MAKQYAVHEIFEILEGIEDEGARVESLKTVNQDFQMLLRLWLDENIKFLLPEEDPPYRPNVDTINTLQLFWGEIRKLNLFIAGFGYDHLKPQLRENRFIQSLEYLHPKDAKLLLALKSRTWPFKTLSKEDVLKAFPDLV